MQSITRSSTGVAFFALVAMFSTARAVEAPPLEAYGELPRVEDAAISPNGGKTAAVVRSNGERRIVIQASDGSPSLNIPAGPSKIRSIEWADNDTILLTNTATVPVVGFTASKLELTGTIILSTKPGAANGLVFGKTDAVADTTRGRYGIRTIDGRTVGFFGGIAYSGGINDRYLQHARTTLYAVDLATNRPRVVASPGSEDHWRDWLVDGAGKVAATLDLSQTTGEWQITSAKGVQMARGVTPVGDINLLCLGRDGTTSIYTTEDAEGNSHWFEVPLTGGGAKEILADVNVGRVFVDGSNGRFLGYRTMDEEPRTVMEDPVQQSAVTRIFRAFKGREATLIDWTPGFTEVLVRTTGNGDSGTWYFVDVANKRAEPIGHERPAIKPDQVGPISTIAYKARDGLEMNGILTLPPGRDPKNLPVIMLPHGGPAAHDTPEFDWWAQAFASRGYAVFQPNFRGSTGRSDSFRHAGDGEWGRKMQTDISDGLTELAKRGIVDPKRACIVGASYGGYAALAGVTLQNGFYRCAVSVGGVSDLKMMYSADMYQSGRSATLGAALREQLGDPKRFDEVSPRRFAAKADAPVLLIHGKDDTVVPFRQSMAMSNALKAAGKPYELVPLPGEDHWLSREETRKRMLTETMQFVQKYNPAN